MFISTVDRKTVLKWLVWCQVVFEDVRARRKIPGSVCVRVVRGGGAIYSQKTNPHPSFESKLSRLVFYAQSTIMVISWQFFGGHVLE